jgi:hypothetical protein
VWTLFLGAVLASGVRALLAGPNALNLALCISAFVAVGETEVTGDRVDLLFWVLFGLLLAATARGPSDAHRGGRGKQAEGSAEKGPQPGPPVELSGGHGR